MDWVGVLLADGVIKCAREDVGGCLPEDGGAVPQMKKLDNLSRSTAAVRGVERSCHALIIPSEISIPNIITNDEMNSNMEPPPMFFYHIIPFAIFYYIFRDNGKVRRQFSEAQRFLTSLGLTLWVVGICMQIAAGICMNYQRRKVCKMGDDGCHDDADMKQVELGSMSK